MVKKKKIQDKDIRLEAAKKIRLDRETSPVQVDSQEIDEGQQVDREGQGEDVDVQAQPFTGQLAQE